MNIWLKLFSVLGVTIASKIQKDNTYTPIIKEKPEQPKPKPKTTYKGSESVVLMGNYTIPYKENKPFVIQHISLTKEEAYKQGWHYKRKSNNRLRITRYTGNSKNIIIPAKIDNFVVNEIGKSLFMRSEIDSVQIPDTIKKIGTRAFYRSEVKSVTFAEGVKIIPDETFFTCENLNFLHLPNTLEKIGESAFEKCVSLKDIVLPCCNVGKNAFRYSNLENVSFAMTRYVTYRHLFDGSALQYTPLQNKYQLILFQNLSFQYNHYDVLLVGTMAKVKFPKDSYVHMGVNSVVHGCTLDFSECGKIELNENFIRYNINEHGQIWSHPWCKFIMPENSRYYFHYFVDAKYPDGTKCNEIYETTNIDNTTIVKVNSDFLQSFSLKGQYENLIIESERDVKFCENAISMWKLKTFSSDCLYGEGELFSSVCFNLHKVEFKGKCIYIPCGNFNFNAYRQLLKAFSGRIENGRYTFFDSSIYTQVFCNDIDSYSDCWKWSRKKHIQLSQKNKIMLAVDVLRSSEELFPDRDIYKHYLYTHRRYAMIICDRFVDRLSVYGDFLKNFYS